MSSGITALIRTYNSARTLDDCLSTLKEQTVAPEHTIVVDSGSTDGTLEIAQAYDAQIVHYPDEEFNYSRSLNIGFQHVETPYVLIASSHVYFPVSRTVEVMRDLLNGDRNRCAASVRGWAECIDAAESSLEWELVTKNNFISEHEGSAISNSCNLVPFRFWSKQAFDEDIPRCEDQKWLKYHLERERTAVRIERPEIIYDNPNYTYRKDVKDRITIAKYDINPKLKRWANVFMALKEAILSLLKLKRSGFLRSIHLFFGLMLVRLGIHFDSTSKYF